MTKLENSNDSVQDWLEDLVQSSHDLPNAISGILGKSLSPSSRKELLQFINTLLKETRLFVNQSAECVSLEGKDKFLLIGKSLDTYLRALMPDIPMDMNVIDYLVQRIDPPMNSIMEPEHPTWVSYIDCDRELRRLVNNVYSSLKYEVLDEYLEEVDGYTEDIYPIAQVFTVKGKGHSRLLLTPRKRFTRKIAEESIMVYSDLAGALLCYRGGKQMVENEKAIEGGLRAWLLVLLVGNLIFVGVGLYSGIYHAIHMGISDHPILQIATGITCILNVSLIYFVFRRKKWSTYALVAGLGIASVLFALSVFAAVEPTDPPEDKAMTVPFTVIVFLIGLAITIVSARVLRPVMRMS